MLHPVAEDAVPFGPADRRLRCGMVAAARCDGGQRQSQDPYAKHGQMLPDAAQEPLDLSLIA